MITNFTSHPRTPFFKRITLANFVILLLSFHMIASAHLPNSFSKSIRSNSLSMDFPADNISDLDLTLAVQNPEYTSFEHVNFEVVVQNFGPAIATNVTASIPLPPGTVASSGTSATQGTFNGFNGIWNIGSLEIGQTVLLQLVLYTLDENGPKTVFAQVQTADQSDPDSTPGNDNNQTPDEDDEAIVTIYPEGYSNCGGTITISSQAEMDALGSCSIWDGDITIQGADIINLQPFAGLTEITGDLTILNCSQLESLDGLQNLSTIGSDFNLLYSTQLMDVDELTQLTMVDGHLHISGNPVLDNLDGLTGISTITKSLVLSNNFMLQNLGGLSNVNQIGGDVEVAGNSLLSTINILNGINTINGSLNILGNDQLEEIIGLANVQSVASSVIISGNPMLDNIEGLSSLQNMDSGDFVINDNDQLLNLDQLSNLTSVNGNLHITNNALLNNCCGLYSLLDGAGVSGSITIENNPSFCSNTTEIINNCASCSGDITLTSQAEVDAFGPCTFYDGSITIQGSDITDLSAFDELEEISGSLKIQYNNSLLELNGFHNLTTVGGFLKITYNSAMTSMNAFSSLQTIASGLDVIVNHALENVQNFSPSFFANRFYFIQNNMMENIDGFAGLTDVNDIYFDSNELLENFDGLSNIPSQVTRIKMEHNVNIQNLAGLSHLEYVGYLQLTNMGLLPSLEEISNLDSVGSIQITYNDMLQDLEGLHNLQAANNMSIYGNDLLSNCCAIYPVIVSSNPSLSIWDNPSFCSNGTEIINNCATPNVCTGDVVLNNQAEVDAFDCEVISGNLVISGTVTDLSPMQMLHTVDGGI